MADQSDMSGQWNDQMTNPRWPEYVRVLACLQLHSLRFGRELCLIENRGVSEPLRSTDIARMAGLDRSNVRRGLAWLEREGFCQRLSLHGVDAPLTRGNIGIMCWARPGMHKT
jgi:hypothetical protein